MGRSNLTRRGPLPSPQVRADDPALTRFAGVIPAIRYMSEVLELPQRLLFVVDQGGRKVKYSRHHLLFAFLVGSLLGVERLAHLEWLRGDAVLQKYLRLPSWPVRKVFAQALAGLSAPALRRLEDLLTAVGLWSIGVASDVILDFDSSTIVSFGEQEGAVFGYCGKGRNRRRHHPLVASVASTRAVVHALYRDGTAINAQEAIAFFKDTLRRVRLGVPGCAATIRADSGFWSLPMGDWLLLRKIPFIMSFPLKASLKIMLPKAVWTSPDGDPDLQLTTLSGSDLGLDARLRVVAIRRFVHDPKAPPQGKTVEWDPDWRYQALVTSLDWEPEDAWRFYNDRGDCERIFKVAKHALGMNWLVSHDFTANSAAFILRLLAYNADLLFQRYAEAQARKDGRPVVRQGLQARQARFFLAAGRLLLSHNRWVLRIPDNEWVRRLWSFYAPELCVWT